MKKIVQTFLKMLQIKNLQVKVGEKQILNGVDLSFETGKNYCLLGKNGSGKSSLSSFLMGNPKYEHAGGSVTLDGEDLLKLAPEERSARGLFLSFQNIPEIEGIKLGEFLRTIYNIHLKKRADTESSSAGQKDFKDISPFIFKRHIKKYLEELHIDEQFLDRDLNVGFSGGEKRKIEILQMKLIGPRYIILDEIDSGLDLDAFKKVCQMLQNINSESNSLIIITHYFTILEYFDIDEVYILRDGEVVKKGGADVVEEVKENGYEV